MSSLDKQELRVPERKKHDWSQAGMRDCDFCSQWSLTIKHDDGGWICASCCDAEYTSELKGALEVAIDRAEAAEKRITELEAEQWRNPVLVYANSYRDMAKKGVESVPIWSVITDLERNIAPLYAAMLQGKAEPVSPRDGLTFDQWLLHQNEKIPVDCGCVNIETFLHWLRVAYESGSSPVIPDGCAAMQVQPLIIDSHGTLRFKENPIVRKLLDYSTNRGYGLNEIALEQFDAADQMQLAQLIGYSLSGYGTLSYVTDESYELALAAAPQQEDE